MKLTLFFGSIALSAALLGTPSSHPASHVGVPGSCSADNEFIELIRLRASDIASGIDHPHAQATRDSFQVPYVEAHLITHETTDSLCAKAGVWMNQNAGLPPGTPRSVVLYRVGPKVWGEDPRLEYSGRQTVHIFDSLVTTLLTAISM